MPFYAADSFIHGIIQSDGDGGTCATMPVVYAAVGRRLGYPIKLVRTQRKSVGHQFARWDELGKRFNIEATNKGMWSPPDDYYRKDPRHDYDLPPDVEAEGCLLQSKTPRMELAGFMGERAWRWADLKKWRQAVESWAWASSIHPQNQLALNSLKRALGEWDEEQRLRKPERFPIIWVQRRADLSNDLMRLPFIKSQHPVTSDAKSYGKPHFRGGAAPWRPRAERPPDTAQHRLYPGIPFEIEQDILGFIATENMLSDPRLEAKYWNRMRRGDFEQTPTGAVATFSPNESCSIDLRFN